MTKKKHNAQHLIVSPTAIHHHHHNPRLRVRDIPRRPRRILRRERARRTVTSGCSNPTSTQYSIARARVVVVASFIALVVVTRTARLIAFSGFAKFPMYRDMVATIRASTSRRASHRGGVGRPPAAPPCRDSNRETKRTPKRKAARVNLIDGSYSIDGVYRFNN